MTASRPAGGIKCRKYKMTPPGLYTVTRNERCIKPTAPYSTEIHALDFD